MWLTNQSFFLGLIRQTYGRGREWWIIRREWGFWRERGRGYFVRTFFEWASGQGKALKLFCSDWSGSKFGRGSSVCARISGSMGWLWLSKTLWSFGTTCSACLPVTAFSLHQKVLLTLDCYSPTVSVIFSLVRAISEQVVTKPTCCYYCYGRDSGCYSDCGPAVNWLTSADIWARFSTRSG